MSRTLFITFAALLVLAGCAPDRSDEIARLSAEVDSLREIAGPPPASLDSLYPPVAGAPVYQLAMFEMATPLTATTLKTMEGDAAGAMKHFERFRAAYLKVSGMVPEWKRYFPTAPVDEMASALGSGDAGKVMAAAGRIGATCHDCHAVTMAKVQQTRHWDEFSAVSVTDPSSGRDLPFPEFMMSLEGAYTGIGMALEEGNPESARRYFEAFNTGFGRLREACAACHETERAYFVDRSVQASIDALGSALRSRAPDPAMVGSLMMKIGQESCGKCHLVHVPAAYTQARMREWSAAASGHTAGE